MGGPLVPEDDHGGEGPPVHQLIKQLLPNARYWVPAGEEDAEDNEEKEQEEDEEKEELEEGQDEEEEEEDEEPLLWELPAGTLFYHGCLAPLPTDADGQRRLFAQLGSDGRDQLCFGTSVESTISAHILLEHVVRTNEKVARGITLPRNHLPSDQVQYGYVYVFRSLQPLVLERADYAGDPNSAAANALRKEHPPHGKLIQPDIPFARWPAGKRDVTERKKAMVHSSKRGFSLEYNFPAAEATTAKLHQRFQAVARLTVDIDAWIEAMTVNHPQGLCTHPVISEVQSWPAAAGVNNAHAPKLPCFAHA